MYYLPSMQQFSNISPLISVDFVRIENDSFFVEIYGGLFDARVQVIVPPLATLLSSSSADVVFVG